MLGKITSCIKTRYNRIKPVSTQKVAKKWLSNWILKNRHVQQSMIFASGNSVFFIRVTRATASALYSQNLQSEYKRADCVMRLFSQPQIATKLHVKLRRST